MTIPTVIGEFWSAFVATLVADPSHRFYEAFHFNDNAPTADELAQLVLSGKKRATAGLVWAFESEDKPIPMPGDLSVVTLLSGQPVCIIETREVKIMSFSEVDADFAAIEGEGDVLPRVLAAGTYGLLRKVCKRLGREFSVSAPVVCETFDVVYRGGAACGLAPDRDYTNRQQRGWCRPIF